MIDLLAAFLLHLDLTCWYMLLTAVQKAQTPRATSATLGFLGQRSWMGEMQHLKQHITYCFKTTSQMTCK